MGTLQGGIQRQHLDYYLDEFAFRFDRRNARGMLFCRLAQQAVAIGPATYRSIVDPGDDGAADRHPWGDTGVKCIRSKVHTKYK
jgi:hypothetical protein